MFLDSQILESLLFLGHPTLYDMLYFFLAFLFLILLLAVIVLCFRFKPRVLPYVYDLALSDPNLEQYHEVATEWNKVVHAPYTLKYFPLQFAAKMYGRISTGIIIMICVNEMYGNIWFGIGNIVGKGTFFEYYSYSIFAVHYFTVPCLVLAGLDFLLRSYLVSRFLSISMSQEERPNDVLLWAFGPNGHHIAWVYTLTLVPLTLLLWAIGYAVFFISDIHSFSYSVATLLPYIDTSELLFEPKFVWESVINPIGAILILIVVGAIAFIHGLVIRKQTLSYISICYSSVAKSWIYHLIHKFHLIWAACLIGNVVELLLNGAPQPFMPLFSNLAEWLLMIGILGQELAIRLG